MRVLIGPLLATGLFFYISFMGNKQFNVQEERVMTSKIIKIRKQAPEIVQNEIKNPRTTASSIIKTSATTKTIKSINFSQIKPKNRVNLTVAEIQIIGGQWHRIDSKISKMLF